MKPLRLSRERCSGTGTVASKLSVASRDLSIKGTASRSTTLVWPRYLRAWTISPSDASIFQRGPGALESEVYALALVADEGLEGGWHPAPGAGWSAYPGQGLKARPAEQVARAPLAADAVLGVEEVGEGRDVWLQGLGHQVSASQASGIRLQVSGFC